MSLPLTFQIGEKVVYRNQGVGTIENISARSFGSQLERFYFLRLGCVNLTVMAPFSHVDDLGLRKITRSAGIGHVLDFLACGKCRSSHGWKNRVEENAEKMRFGNLSAIAEVLKTLLLQQHEKPLSFRERKMLDRARYMLVTEVAISRSICEREAVDMLQKVLAKASLSLPQPR